MLSYYPSVYGMIKTASCPINDLSIHPFIAPASIIIHEAESGPNRMGFIGSFKDECALNLSRVRPDLSYGTVDGGK